MSKRLHTIVAFLFAQALAGAIGGVVIWRKYRFEGGHLDTAILTGLVMLFGMAVVTKWWWNTYWRKLNSPEPDLAAGVQPPAHPCGDSPGGQPGRAPQYPIATRLRALGGMLLATWVLIAATEIMLYAWQANVHPMLQILSIVLVLCALLIDLLALKKLLKYFKPDKTAQSGSPIPKSRRR